MPKSTNFNFEISLSVLNHLGRNLYRSFATILGEAVSNSWDAGAHNVWIFIDKDNDNLVIKDDGRGMRETDFQNKFLKIGYSKRNDSTAKPLKGRSFIGRKGIGKLALLSCADRIHILSKTSNTNYVGGVIDNSGLDKAIKKDLASNQYKLEDIDKKLFNKYTENHKKGTVILFENINEGIKNSLEFLKKIVALYFRFSLIDSTFNIYINGDKVSFKNLKDLAEKTQFLWVINDIKDPYVNNLFKIKDKNEEKILKENKTIKSKQIHFKGFIASVQKPRDLNILGTGERIGIDLFVNGRLREKDILKHKPTSRLVENYLYGQIHCNILDKDKGIDRFTSSREGIVADDPLFEKMLDELRSKVITTILEDWDKWREKHRYDGDPENQRKTKKERKVSELFNAVAEDYQSSEKSVNRKKIDSWIDEIKPDAEFNYESYADCFISENLIRKYIKEKKMAMSKESNIEVKTRRKNEVESKSKGNISIDIRHNNDDLFYLSMTHLANLVDKPSDKAKKACLSRDADEYKPMRDALAHTSRLTESAKKKLTSVYENIKGRVNNLLEN